MGLRALLLPCLLSALFLPALSLRVSKEQTFLDPGRSFVRIDTFGFLEGGSLDITTSSKSTIDGYFLCTRKGLENLLKQSNWSHKYCSRHQRVKSPCELAYVSPHSSILHNYTVQSFDRYTLGFLNCKDRSGVIQKLELEYIFVNPHSELSADDIPLLVVYPVFAGLWLVVILGMLAVSGWAYYSSLSYEREQVTAPAFHLFFLLVAFSKLVVTILTGLYWYQFHTDGNRDSTLKQTAHTAYTLSECFLFSFLLLFSNGWRILTIMEPEKFGRWSYFLVILSPFLFLFYFDPMASLMMLYLFLPPVLFSDLTQNIKYINFRIMWVESVEDRIDEDEREIWRWTLTSLSTKLFVYETALTPLVLYLVFLVISKLILFFLPWYLGFLSTIFHECVVIVFFVYFFWVVSPFRAEGGLFWVPTFGDDLESQRDWIEATQHAYSEVDSLKRRRKVLTSYEYVAKNVQLVQYVEKKGEDEEEGQGVMRKLWLAILMGRRLCAEGSKEEMEVVREFEELDELEEREGGEEMEEELVVEEDEQLPSSAIERRVMQAFEESGSCGKTPPSQTSQ